MSVDWDKGSQSGTGVRQSRSKAKVLETYSRQPGGTLPALGLPAYSGQVAGLLVGGAICLACAVVPLRMVRDRVDRLNES